MKKYAAMEKLRKLIPWHTVEVNKLILSEEGGGFSDRAHVGPRNVLA
jgi:hypothetical protein